jgi:acylphosphatase
MKAAAKFTIHGTVQGIFYRQFVVEQAEKYKLRGFVRNLPDSVVEVIAEGEKDNLAKFESQLKVGPPRSQIRHIQKEEKKFSGDFTEFKVIHF